MTDLTTKNYDLIIKEFETLPELQTLPPKSIEKVARFVAVQLYADKMKKDIAINGFKLDALLSQFLSTLNSAYTRRAYSRSIDSFLFSCHQKNLNPLKTENKDADAYAVSLVRSGSSPASVRLALSALSAFYAYLDRITDGVIKNIFAGVKKPKKKTTKKDKFYSSPITPDNLDAVRSELDAFISHIENKQLRSALVIMKNCGLRIGAFENIVFSGSSYITTSKGKQIKGRLSDNCLNELKALGCSALDFKGFNAKNAECNILGIASRLRKKGVIKSHISAHDFRHFFAINDYLANKDIVRLSALLNHSSIMTTETYLKGLNLC